MPTDDQDEASFERRLAAARERHGLEKRAAADGPGEERLPVNPLALMFRVGVELVSALVVGVAIGFALDRWLGTRPWFLALFVVLGGAAGVLNVWRLVAPRPERAGRK
jgi:ATP synthase protein I